MVNPANLSRPSYSHYQSQFPSFRNSDSVFFHPFPDTANVNKLMLHWYQSNLFLALTGYGIISETNLGTLRG